MFVELLASIAKGRVGTYVNVPPLTTYWNRINSTLWKLNRDNHCFRRRSLEYEMHGFRDED